MAQLADMPAQVLGVFGITVVAATGAAYAFFRFLGEKWLDQKFQKGFAEYEHEQDKALQKAKFEIDRILDRYSLSNRKEYDILPTAWSLAFEAYSYVQGAIVSFQKLPDLNGMGPEKLEIFISGSELSDFHKSEVLNAHDKTQMFAQIQLRLFMMKTSVACRDARLYIAKNSIFMPDQIAEKFEECMEIIWNAYIEREMEEQRNRRGSFTEPPTPCAIDIFPRDARPSLDQLKSEIRSRLMST